MVRTPYPHPHPPHVVAREIARTSWIDFRPFSTGPDPTDASHFEQRYPVTAHLKRQLNNVKRKGCLWDLDGTWLLKFVQDKTENSLGVASFEAHITLNHTKFLLSGGGAIHYTTNPAAGGGGGKSVDIPVSVDGAHLDSSSLSFVLNFSKDENEGAITVKAMISTDGKSLEGKWFALDVGDWCNEAGFVAGKITREKKKAPKKKK